MAETRNPFAQWLNATMQTRGLSQADVAREMRVADIQVSRWRRGHAIPSVRSLQQIADTFCVPRVTLERMAGYPGHDQTPAPGGELDPETEAELQAYQVRYRAVLEGDVPRALWQAYMEACEALARSLSASFRAAEAQLTRDPARGEHHQMGFRRRDIPDPNNNT